MIIARLFATVRPWTPAQCVGRMRAAGKGYLKRTFPVSARMLLRGLNPAGLLPAPFSATPVRLIARNSTALEAEARNIINGTFAFHGATRHFGGRVEWQNRAGNYVWDVELHSFRFLDSLRCLAEDAALRGRAVRCGKELMRDWLLRSTYPHSPAWHSEVISKRALYWVKFLIDYAGPGDGDLLDSLSEQVTCLERNIETFLPGTQLIENGLALAATGLYFCCDGRPRQWLDKGTQILKSTLNRQVLPGGGHIQRSPMYQCVLLEGLLTCYSLFRARRIETPWLQEKIEAMLRRLLDALHPDGGIPLLNDSAFGYAPEPGDIVEYAERAFGFRRPPPTRKHEDDGYIAFRDSTSFLIIDGGPIGPDYLPSHGHADTLSYEMSVAKQRVIVDSGVYGYQADGIRAYCRGTAAHSTVVVDSCDQSEMWRAFRVGHRAHSFDPVVADRGGLSFFVGGHDGYRNLPGGVIHRRTLLHARERFFVVSDSLTGTGSHRIESHIHLAPGLEPEWQGDRMAVNAGGRIILQIIPFGCAPPQKDYNWYCPRFGEKVPGADITFLLVTELPCRFGYFLIPGDAEVAAACGFEKNHSFYSVGVKHKPPCTIRGDGRGYLLSTR